MKKYLLIMSIFIFTILMGCTNNTSVVEKDIIVSIDYLGETPPKDEAILFNPEGYLSNEEWHWHGTPVFSNDGKEMYFSKYIKSTNDIEIWYTIKTQEIWSKAVKLAIPGIEGSYNNPVLSKDGNTLYVLNFKESKFTIYKLTREDHNWINPEPLDIEIPDGKALGWQFSVSDNNNIYFLLWDLKGLEHQKIYISVYKNGAYDKPIPINILDNNSNGVGGPLIAPDESYIIFDSERNGGFGMHDLYISFKDTSGAFLTPVNLGHKVNSTSEDTGAYLSPDGQYLFYLTQKNDDKGYNPYWIKLEGVVF